MRTVQELFQSFNDTVLLVGNGVMQHQRELIDSYETVVRFNKFKIEGFEEHVGTKINAIGLASANLEMEYTKHLQSVYEKYIDVVPLFAFNDGSEEYTGKMHLPELRTRLFGPGYDICGVEKTRLSTGISTTLNLALFFDKKVHLIGFDFMQSGHYWETDHTHSPNHNGSFEKTLVEKISTITVL